MPSLPVLLFPRQSTADHSNHNTVMSDFTQHDSHSSGSSSGSSSSPSSSMDMSHSSSGTMNMIFHVGTTDPLFSASWAPSTTGQYVGTVFFLIALGFVYRFLAAYQNVLNHRWAKAEKERKVLIAGKTGSQDSGIDTKDQKEVTVVDKNEAQEGLWAGRPWRWSVDLPRSGMVVLNAGMGYLLMLGVMTMNVGYFMAVLGGIFVGELVWGRWIKGGSH